MFLLKNVFLEKDSSESYVVYYKQSAQNGQEYSKSGSIPTVFLQKKRTEMQYDQNVKYLLTYYI